MKSYSKIKLKEISLEDQLNNIKAEKGNMDFIQYSKEDLDNINEVFALYRELKSLRFFIDRGNYKKVSKEELLKNREELKNNLEKNANELVIEIEKRWWKLSAEARIVILKDASACNNPIVEQFLKFHVENANRLEQDEIIYRMIFLDLFQKYNIPIERRNILFRKYIDAHKIEDKYYARLKMAVNLEKILEMAEDEKSNIKKEQIISYLSKNHDNDNSIKGYGSIVNDFQDVIVRNNFLNWAYQNEKAIGGGLLSKDELTQQKLDAFFSEDSTTFDTIYLSKLLQVEKILTYPRTESYYKKVDPSYIPYTSAEKNKKNPKYTFEQLFEMYIKSDIFRKNEKTNANDKINRFYDTMLKIYFGEPSIRDIEFIESIYYEARKHPEIANSRSVEEYYFPIRMGEERVRTKTTREKSNNSKDSIDFDRVEEYIQTAEDNGITYIGEFLANSGVKAKNEEGVHYYEFQIENMKFLVPIGQKNNAIRIINSNKSMKEISENMIKKGLAFNDLIVQGKASKFYNMTDELYDPNRLIIFYELAKRCKLFSKNPDILANISREKLTLSEIRDEVTKVVSIDKIKEAAKYVRELSTKIGFNIDKKEDINQERENSSEDVFLNDYFSDYQIKRFIREASYTLSSKEDEEGFFFNKVKSDDEIVENEVEDR